jgi:hypothetical protein
LLVACWLLVAASFALLAVSIVRALLFFRRLLFFGSPKMDLREDLWEAEADTSQRE